MAETKRHYFDWAATALPDNRLTAEAAIGSQPAFANPSSKHLEGRTARETLENARVKCAQALSVKPETLYFTSGGTESNNIVLYSMLKKTGKGRVMFSAVEHPSVRDNCYVLEQFGIPVTPVAVEKDGRVNPKIFIRTLEKHPDTRMAAIMSVNNETGAIMDTGEIVRQIRQSDLPVHVHCDLVQAAGKILLDIKSWGIDSASFSAHKLGGPRGIGLLYLKKPVEPLFAGGQENGIRPGTENIAGAMALAQALQEFCLPDAVAANTGPAQERWNFLIHALKSNNRFSLIPEDRTENDPRFSPWILQARFKGIPGEVMVRALDSEGFAISTGSACSSSHKERPVLKAMGLDESSSLEGIRISQGWTTTGDDIEALIAGIDKVLRLL
ncbi:MAG: cysteine desulfurase [Treponema sp.]|nr:cysteine desulfurase [Treponema sp.]